MLEFDKYFASEIQLQIKSVSSRGEANGTLIKYDMMHSANKRTPIEFDAFRENSTPDPPL